MVLMDWFSGYGTGQGNDVSGYHSMALFLRYIILVKGYLKGDRFHRCYLASILLIYFVQDYVIRRLLGQLS